MRIQAALLGLLACPCAFVVNGFAPPANQFSRLSSSRHATVEKPATTAEKNAATQATFEFDPPFANIMAANRAEIAVRIMRAATELNCGTVGIYAHEDRYSQHRWGADQSFVLEKDDLATPISAYLDIAQIIKIAKEHGVDAIHPGYGFLSESPEFAQACEDADITFVGPTVENLNRFSDKTSARQAAIEAGVPVVPGSDGAMTSAEQVVEFVEGIGLPIIIKVRLRCMFVLFEKRKTSGPHSILTLLFLGFHGWWGKRNEGCPHYGRAGTLVRSCF
jgi:hypothetical protein